MRTKIIINGNFLSEQYTGIGKYSINIIKNIATKIDPNEILVIFLDQKNKTEIVVEFLERNNLPYKIFKFPKFIPHRLKLLLFEYIIIPKFIRKQSKNYGKTIYYSPYLHPFFGSKIKNTRILMTIHDIFTWKYYEYQTKTTRKILNFLNKQVIRKEFIELIAISEYTSKEIKEHFHINKQINIIYDGIDNLVDLPLLPYKEISDKFKLTQPYIFYLGGFDKRKNVDFLIKFFNKYQEELNCQLVLGGNIHYNSSLYLDLNNIDNPNIVKTGFIDDRILKALIYYAGCFVHLAKDEGFNIPIGNSLLEGTKVIASNIEAHREIYGKYVELVDLSNDNQIFESINNCLVKNEKLDKITIDEIRDKYSWEKEANKLIKLIYG